MFITKTIKQLNSCLFEIKKNVNITLIANIVFVIPILYNFDRYLFIMAGIYIHIPFCRQKCHYCNFYSLASMKYFDEVVDAIGKELVLAKHFLPQNTVDTIYFGGGSPSLLSEKHLNYLFDILKKNYSINNNAEITLEANPDDLTEEKVMVLAKTPVNRLSIGIQSFNDDDLKYLNRSHDSQTAINAIGNARLAGIENLTIDLIYGIPVSTNDTWESNLQKCFELKIPHISCYALTLEPNTALDVLIKKKKLKPISDEQIIEQFNILTKQVKKHSYEQYEISNFCREQRYAKHNTGYWFGEPYVGVGPSAHSYNGISRRWNVANIKEYLASIDSNTIPFSSEKLTVEQRYDEYVMTRLRTQWGINIKDLQKLFGKERRNFFVKTISKFISTNHIEQNGDVFIFTDKGKLISDHVISELFF